MLKIDPLEQLLKANVIVGTLTPRAADHVRWLVARGKDKS